LSQRPPAETSFTDPLEADGVSSRLGALGLATDLLHHGHKVRGVVLRPKNHSTSPTPSPPCPEGTFFDRPDRPWPQTSRSVRPNSHAAANEPAFPISCAAPLTARDAVDPRHVHEQPDKPVPGPSHVRNGQSLSAQGSPHSGYPGDPSPPAPQPQRGWLPPATIRNHPLFRRSRTARPARRPPAPGTTDPGRGPRG
jgi:hypothetical protein